MRLSHIFLTLLTLLTISCSHSTKTSTTTSTYAKVGKPIPAWREGYLDIHLINSGRGECCFYILPDGTTMIVDAGEVAEHSGSVAQRPNPTTRPYITYSEYIKHFMPKDRGAIDYCIPSHLHIDHIGCSATATESSTVGYRKSGLLALYDKLPYNHIIDGYYPNYTEDESTPEPHGELSKDWAAFVKWGVVNKKFTAERFTVGKEQMVMLYDANSYKNFSLFNICANGFVWGKDSDGNPTLKGKKSSVGNPSSCGFHISYGKFDFIACGDLVGSAQNLMALYFRDFIGNGNLDAFKSNHHLAANSWGSQMIKCNFDPRIVLNHCFASNKPDIEKLNHALGISEALFSTNIHPTTAATNRELIDRISGYNGHILLRVSDGGEQFYVYMLDDSNFEYRVKSIHGPYIAK